MSQCSRSPSRSSTSFSRSGRGWRLCFTARSRRSWRRSYAPRPDSRTQVRLFHKSLLRNRKQGCLSVFRSPRAHRAARSRSSLEKPAVRGAKRVAEILKSTLGSPDRTGTDSLQADKAGTSRRSARGGAAWAVPFDNVGDGVLAQPEFATNQAVAAPLGDQGEDLRRETIRFRPLSGLAAKTFATGLRRGNA